MISEAEFKNILEETNILLNKGLIDPYSAAERVYKKMGLDKIHERSMAFAKYWKRGLSECEDKV